MIIKRIKPTKFKAKKHFFNDCLFLFHTINICFCAEGVKYEHEALLTA